MTCLLHAFTPSGESHVVIKALKEKAAGAVLHNKSCCFLRHTVLQITVTDSGTPAKSVAVRVIVKVLDINDNTPQFLEKVYKIQLPARARTADRQPVYRVIASDQDAAGSPNAEVTYSIEDGDRHGKFVIDPRTGMVSSRESFAAGEYNILMVGCTLPTSLSPLLPLPTPTPCSTPHLHCQAYNGDPTHCVVRHTSATRCFFLTSQQALKVFCDIVQQRDTERGG